MIVEVRHIERTSLKSEPLVKLIKRYATTKRPIRIVFDRRFTKDNGSYIFDGKRHVIRISTMLIQPYEFITTILHELRHLKQWQEEKAAFWSKARTPEHENDAVRYENKHVFTALDYYEKLVGNA